jgi:heterodisulfide reductase subunit C2
VIEPGPFLNAKEKRKKMPIEISEKTIKHEFIEKVSQLSGQDIFKCFQCGTCGGGCPMSGQMETLPRRIMRMAQLGMEESVSGSKTSFTCASCHTCTVNCPRGIDLARVMEAVRLLTLRKNVNMIEPSRLPAETVRELPQIALVSCFRKLTS